VSVDLFGVKEPEKARFTERDMLDLIHARYSVDAGNGPRYVVAEHVRNQGGFGWEATLRTADAIAVDLWPSSGHLIHGFEVKVSRSDWLTELRDPEKCEAFKPYCHHWWLVVPDASIVRDDLPVGWGLLSIGGDGRLRIRRRAPKLDPQPMPFTMTAAMLRAASKTAVRLAANQMVAINGACGCDQG
jgi:hypothetical protein